MNGKIFTLDLSIRLGGREMPMETEEDWERIAEIVQTFRSASALCREAPDRLCIPDQHRTSPGRITAALRAIGAPATTKEIYLKLKEMGVRVNKSGDTSSLRVMLERYFARAGKSNGRDVLWTLPDDENVSGRRDVEPSTSDTTS